ncbi:hypothetical protein BHT19_0005480 [[Kluyvera] intestini]|nr:hypothetical protein BHT19_0005480 [[Kluyvera] intestini]
MRARTVPSPLWGEGQGEGGNAALMAISFTLCSLLFCRHRTRERARGDKDVAMVIMRENELAVAKKVEDIHIIYGFGAR